MMALPSMWQLCFAVLAGCAVGQVFVPEPQDLTIVPSELFQGAEISFKKTSVCETTEGVNAYSGYVTLPKDMLIDATEWEDDQAAHLFFWYFEARNDPKNAPTSLYFGGGPGTTSFDGMSDFPCFANPDGNSTRINEFSWNNNVNMLYIDQPVHTGFSYVTLHNATMDFTTNEVVPVDSLDHLPELNVTVRQVTLDVKDPVTATNNTMSSARTIWTFAQVWFNEFPHWQTSNDEISLWAVSYGGFYGPGFFDHFQDQNELISNNITFLPNATILNLATLGLADACVDARAMAMGYPTFAFNNTFGLEIYSEDVYDTVMQSVTAPEIGCYALTDRCRALADEGDPLSFGNNKTVNEACAAATNLCFNELQGAYGAMSNRSNFDVTHSNRHLYPVPYLEAFLNQRWVQEDLGVPLNFTMSTIDTIVAFFQGTGDPMRRSLHTLERVMERGVNVALIYGDRDYGCNWYGGENVSLTLDFSSADSFRAAGYEPIITNSSYEGGLVREQGPLSFSRIYQAGHGVAGYQPETLSHIFDRVMFGYDVATGEVSLAENADYATRGPVSVYDVLNEVPALEENVCLVPDAAAACTEEQLAALVNGSAIIENFVALEPRGATPEPIESKNRVQSGDGEGEDEGGSGYGEHQPSGGQKVVAMSSVIIVTSTIVSLIL